MKSFIIHSMNAKGIKVPQEEAIEELREQWENLQRQKEKVDERLLKDADIFHTYHV